jgi:putative membrane protein
MPLLLLHPDQAPAPHDAWAAWNGDPLVLAALALSAVGYARGVRRVWARAGRGHGVRRWQAAAFTGAWVAVFLALVSPIDAIADALFSVHMVQHLLLMLVAAPLLALAAPTSAFLWALPPRARRALARVWRRSDAMRAAYRTLAHPATAWAVAACVLWLWHVPAIYDIAVAHDVVHGVQHATFFATALLFWRALVDPLGPFRRAQGAGLLYTFFAALHGMLLGALLTLAARPWYAAHDATTIAWGLSPLQDQQAAGAIMWMPAGVIYAVAVALLIVRWVHVSEVEVERQERAGRGGAIARSAFLLLAGAALAGGCAGGDDDRAVDAGAIQVAGGGQSEGSADVAGDRVAGERALDTWGCMACHVVPGVRAPGNGGTAGPPLDDWARRGFIAGALPNTRANLIAWLLDPQAIEPGTTMPDVGLSEQEARNIAAYLFALR